MKYPKVSCICPTFCRTALLEEAIECFLRQDYEGEKELVIGNDFYAQNLIFDHKDVKVLNTDTRFTTLGEKRNWVCNHSTGEYLLVWDDDDIYLPGRISRMVNFLQKTNSQFALEGTYYILYGGRLGIVPNTVQGMSIFSKDVFTKINGYSLLNYGEDQDFNKKIQSYLKTPVQQCTDAPQYLYRFGPHPGTHLSVHGADETNLSNNKKTGYEIFYDWSLKQIKDKKEPEGTYILSPHWKQDWCEYAKTAV